VDGRSQHNGSSITENISKQVYYFRCVVNYDPLMYNTTF